MTYERTGVPPMVPARDVRSVVDITAVFGAFTDMLRREPVAEVTTAVSDRELGLAVVLLGVVLVLATILVPLVS
jgi:hypothetical protein